MTRTHSIPDAGADRAAGPARRSWIWSRWPTLLGLGSAAGMLALGADRDAVTVVIGVAALCYLAAAAFDLPWVAWAAVPAGGVAVAAGRLLGLDPWASLAVAAAVLVTVGLLRGSPRRPLTAQALGLLGYGGLAVVALLVAPGAGLVLAATTLIAHGIWDVVHHRRDVVVPRSLAEFCIVLDVPLGVGVLLLTLV